MKHALAALVSKVAHLLESAYHMKITAITIRAVSRRNSDAVHITLDPEKPLEFSVERVSDEARNKLVHDIYEVITAPECSPAR